MPQFDCEIAASQLVNLWAYQHQVEIDVSRPGKPTDNAHVKSFNATLRWERLNTHWFESLSDAKHASRPGGERRTRAALTGRSRIEHQHKRSISWIHKSQFGHRDQRS
ncbi:MAG: transposase [Nitrospira sp. CR1.1]|nr:transposase [Nitrospira sp. CR1.1]